VFIDCILIVVELRIYSFDRKEDGVLSCGPDLTQEEDSMTS
jgi:hypothetical protein